MRIPYKWLEDISTEGGCQCIYCKLEKDSGSYSDCLNTVELESKWQICDLIGLDKTILDDAKHRWDLLHGPHWYTVYKMLLARGSHAD